MTGGRLAKKDWVLLCLMRAPLDRLRLMKTLFLIWRRHLRADDADFFQFRPYLYGPCSFELYSVLETMQEGGSIVHESHPGERWGNYILSHRGKEEAQEARERADANELKAIEEIVKFASTASIGELLNQVYEEAPEYAVKSLFKRLSHGDTGPGRSC